MVLLDDLNKEQREAVEYCDGPLLVIAGAGSGKTRVITYKIAYLIRELGIAPRRIFAATFTNKAAGEMKHRVTQLLGIPLDTPMNVATFHSLAASILRREAEHVGISRNFIICDEKDQRALVKACLKELEVPDKLLKASQAQNLINQVKIRMLDPQEIAEGTTDKNISHLFPTLFELYHRRLRENDALDFEDLIGELTRLLRNNEDKRSYYQELFQYILVDEFQDTNYSQYELVKLLVGAHQHICVVGDEDQSIYSWRGAELDNLLYFADDFPSVVTVKLEQNYRSTGNILESASTVISKNQYRLGKWLWTEESDGEPLYIMEAANEIDEARRVAKQIFRLHRLENVALKDIAVFYRQTSLSRLIEDQLRNENIPYRVIGGIRFYDRAEIKDLISYLRVVANPHNTLSMQRIINRPTRGIGQKTLNTLLQWSLDNGTSLYEAMIESLDNSLLSSRATNCVSEFLALLHGWRRYAEHAATDEILERILDDTEYIDSLGHPQNIETLSKRDNIQELVAAVREYLEENPGTDLEGYLQAVALSTYADDMVDEDVVSLMTIHCAKGLEFPVVFVVGMDEPIFPSHRTLEETGEVEEERRLFYVALTRCKRVLFLSRANIRRIWGKKQFLVPSRFLRELPKERMVSYMERAFDY